MSDGNQQRGKLYACALKTLEDDGWPIREVEGSALFRTSVDGESARISCFMDVMEEYQQLIFYAVAPIKVSEDRFPAAAEYLHRANYGLRIGNFEMDYADGEVRYKSSLDIEDGELLPKMVTNLAYTSARMMDKYLPGLMRVLYGDMEPAAAIEAIEG